MATFSVVILPAKEMANDKHKIRIMVSHNSQTRYVPTDIIIDSVSEFKNGKIVKRPDKDMLNIQTPLQLQIDEEDRAKIYKQYLLPASRFFSYLNGTCYKC